MLVIFAVIKQTSMKTFISVFVICLFSLYFYCCSNDPVTTPVHVPSQSDSVVKLISPLNATAFSDSAYITFNWYKTLNASAYELQISSDTTFPNNSSTETFSVSDTSYSRILQCLGGCIQYWHVRMNINSHTPIYSEIRHFTQP